MVIWSGAGVLSMDTYARTGELDSGSSHSGSFLRKSELGSRFFGRDSRIVELDTASSPLGRPLRNNEELIPSVVVVVNFEDLTLAAAVVIFLSFRFSALDRPGLIAAFFGFLALAIAAAAIL